ncbi:MAG TPA: phosphate ABC transporter substrate-binding protein PstS [Thermoleophilaceae bacterium]|nr:phosphate ABC transporter substrate-binding protein PstS [Thermoleophilaceae bacterium]
MIRKKLALVTAAALAVLGTTAFTATASAESLTGAGSTLVAPLMQQWANDYKSKTGTDITYGAVGSGAGIQQITARSVDFGASDAPLKPSQAQACNNCVQIPWGLTAVTVPYNLPGIVGLKLTPSVLSQIYLGKISTWDNAQIKRINPGKSLPSTHITVAFRSDGSGDTYAFTNYLWKISPEWKSKVGIYATSVNFPVGVGGRGNDGIASVVQSTAGAIGYVSASYAISHNMNVAAIQNAAKKYTFPNLKNISEAAKTIRRIPGNNELHIVSPSKKLAKAYPICTFTYAIVPKSSPKKGTLAGFIKYAISDGQKFGAALDFAPLPAVVKNAATRSANSL